MKFEKVTGREYWADYLINNNASEYDKSDLIEIDKWLKVHNILNVVDVDLETEEFSWKASLRLGIPTEYTGCSVVEYTCEIKE